MSSASFSRLAVKYDLEADSEHRKMGRQSRANFKGAVPKPYHSEGTVTMRSKGKKACVTRQLVVQVAALWKCFSLDQSALWGGVPNGCVLQENIEDKLRGISVDVSVEIQDAKRKRRQSSAPQISPVLDANEPATTTSTVGAKDA